jgi:sulfite dehydrogenase (quinone) subunit SoeC
MHPALSVIIFTVSSGAGYGLLVLLIGLHIFGFLPDMSENELLTGGIIGLGLVTFGLMASTFHLANPKNAWRAFSRFRTSWLSREGLFAVLVYPFALLYLFGIWNSGVELNAFIQITGFVTVILALVTVFSTGMIYGCLKTIRQWNSALTPANYILLGLALGALLLVALRVSFNGEVGLVASLTLVILDIALIAKAIYYFWIRRVTGPSLNTATGFTRANVRLLDVGHTAGTFLTEEFGYIPAQGTVTLFKVLVFVLGFIIPGVLVFGMTGGDASSGMAWIALISAFLGIGFERWLFFAEARHVVNLYHGAQHT